MYVTGGSEAYHPSPYGKVETAGLNVVTLWVTGNPRGLPDDWLCEGGHLGLAWQSLLWSVQAVEKQM